MILVGGEELADRREARGGDFERVLALDFDNLISGHGTPKLGGAKAALVRNVERLPR